MRAGVAIEENSSFERTPGARGGSGVGILDVVDLETDSARRKSTCLFS
jgi:hypothetical protein